MIRVRWMLFCGCSALACSTGDPAQGTTGANTTTGSGPTTFATFSTTAPPPTTATGSTDVTDGASESTAGTTVGDSDTDTAVDVSTTTGASGECPSTHVCLAQAPEGWQGPVAVQRAAFDRELPKAEPPACGEAYPTPAAAGFEDLIASPATCGCECADPNGVACENSTTLRYWGASTTCDSGTPQSVTIFASACNMLPSEFPGGGHYTATPLTTVGGACVPSSQASIEPASWTWLSQVCEGATILEEAGCAAGLDCAPLPDSPDAALCVWQEGEHECPTAFEDSRTLYADVDDSRGCETCSCSAPNGLCDSAVISLWSGATCLVPAAGVIGANGECDPSNSANTARAASLNGGSPNAFCAPS